MKKSTSVFIIAEAGVNHNGDIAMAKKLVEVAAEAGADAVKFQTFIPEALVTDFAGKADYQKQTTNADESQLAMLQKLALSIEDHHTLIEHCKKHSIKFLSSPFDLDSIDLLISIGISILKIPSGEITNLPYLRKIARQGIPVILSTGMSTLGEVEAALNVLLEGGMHRDHITLLHCTTEYPAPYDQVNLQAMQTLKRAFNCSVGYSDHTQGIEVSIAAVALGARVIEKHFTLDRNLDGPDHKASLDPDELKQLVKSIRNVVLALGSKIKTPSPIEIHNMPIARKVIVANQPVMAGEIFSESNISCKRVSKSGISPMLWDSVLGRIAARNFSVNEIIEI